MQAVNSLARAGAFRNDGANGTLPVLNPAELHQLQVDFVDSRNGLRKRVSHYRGMDGGFALVYASQGRVLLVVMTNAVE